MKERISQLTTELLQEMADSGDISIESEITSSMALYGTEGELDSMGLVSLILALEQSIEAEFGVAVALADEKALSQKNSPYRTVESLSGYASELVGGGA